MVVESWLPLCEGKLPSPQVTGGGESSAVLPDRFRAVSEGSAPHPASVGASAHLLRGRHVRVSSGKAFQQKRLDLFKTAVRQTPLTEGGLAAAAALIGGVQRLAGLAQIAAGGSGQRVGKALPAGGQRAAGGAGLGGDCSSPRGAGRRRRRRPPISTAGAPGTAAAAQAAAKRVLQGGQPGLEARPRRACRRVPAPGVSVPTGAGEQPAGGLGVGPAGCRYRVVGALPAGHGQPHTRSCSGRKEMILISPTSPVRVKVGAAAGAAVAAGLDQPHRRRSSAFLLR